MLVRYLVGAVEGKLLIHAIRVDFFVLAIVITCVCSINHFSSVSEQ